MPLSEQIKRLENQLRKLRAQFATQESEFINSKNANKQLDATISANRNDTLVEIQNLQSELAYANNWLEVMAVFGEQPQSN